MRKLFLTFMLAAFSISACGETPTTKTSVAPVTTAPARSTLNPSELELTNPKQDIEVTAGDEFTIIVKTFIDPNYHWEVVEALDANIVEYIWKDHLSDNPNNPSSASGKDVWRFKAVAPGKTTITLGYYVGSSDTAQPEVTFNVVVK